MKPVLKWAGGKTQLLNEIDNLLPDSYNCYYEPFIGGASVLLHLQPEKAIINDYNSELVNLYTVIKEQPNELIKHLKTHINTKTYFENLRNKDRNLDEYNKLSNVEKASRIIYLNRTCFNGLYRVNSKGQFNVPFGNYKNPLICNEDNILDINKYLNENDIIILNDDFENILKLPNENDFVYLDPPYDLVNEQSFISYAKKGFSKEDQKRLKICCDELNKKNVKFLLSNSKTDFIIDLYKDYDINIVLAKRNINSNGAGRGKVEEVLIKNY